MVTLSGKHKRIFTVFVILAMLIGATHTVAVAGSDISGHWAESEIQAWLVSGLSVGYPDGTFRPNNSVSRAEFAAFVNRSFRLPETQESLGFSDVSVGDWYFGVVESATKTGIMSGYPDGTFRPNNPITRQEAAVVISNILTLSDAEIQAPFTDRAQIAAWAKDAVDSVFVAGIMGGYPDGNFWPDRFISRAETVVVLDRALAQFGVTEPEPVDEDDGVTEPKPEPKPDPAPAPIVSLDSIEAHTMSVGLHDMINLTTNATSVVAVSDDEGIVLAVAYQDQTEAWIVEVSGVSTGTTVVSVTGSRSGYTSRTRTFEITVVAPGEYWVSASTGDDGNSGTISEPFATIGKAIDVADRGDVIHIETGTYVENVEIPAELDGLSLLGSTSPDDTMIDGSLTLTINTLVDTLGISGDLIGLPAGGSAITNVKVGGELRLMGTEMGIEESQILGDAYFAGPNIAADMVEFDGDVYGAALSNVSVERASGVNLEWGAETPQDARIAVSIARQAIDFESEMAEGRMIIIELEGVQLDPGATWSVNHDDKVDLVVASASEPARIVLTVKEGQTLAPETELVITTTDGVVWTADWDTANVVVMRNAEAPWWGFEFRWITVFELDASGDATVSSVDTHYTVDDIGETIESNDTTITTDVTVGEFLNNLTKHPQADWKVVPDGTTITDPASFDAATGKGEAEFIAPGDLLAVRAADDTIKVYAITVIGS